MRTNSKSCQPKDIPKSCRRQRNPPSPRGPGGFRVRVKHFRGGGPGVSIVDKAEGLERRCRHLINGLVSDTRRWWRRCHPTRLGIIAYSYIHAIRHVETLSGLRRCIEPGLRWTWEGVQLYSWPDNTALLALGSAGDSIVAVQDRKQGEGFL